MPLFILERKNTARRNSLAVSTYLMTGFNNEVECASAWNEISHQPHPSSYKIYTLDEYIDSRTVHEIATNTSVLRADKGSDGKVHLSTLPKITSHLISKKSILVINVIAPLYPEKYSGNEMIEVKNVTAEFVKSILFERKDVGEYIHSVNSGGPSLTDVISKYNHSGDSSVVILYNNLDVSTLQAIESELFFIPHESVLLTKYTMFHIIIGGKEMILQHICERLDDSGGSEDENNQ